MWSEDLKNVLMEMVDCNKNNSEYYDKRVRNYNLINYN